MSYLTPKEKITDSLYNQCSNRSLSTKEVVTNMMGDLQLVFSDDMIEKIIEIVRPYKNSGSSFEDTVNKIYDEIYSKPKVGFSYY